MACVLLINVLNASLYSATPPKRPQLASSASARPKEVGASHITARGGGQKTNTQFYTRYKQRTFSACSSTPVLAPTYGARILSIPHTYQNPTTSCVTCQNGKRRGHVCIHSPRGTFLFHLSLPSPLPLSSLLARTPYP